MITEDDVKADLNQVGNREKLRKIYCEALDMRLKPYNNDITKVPLEDRYWDTRKKLQILRAMK